MGGKSFGADIKASLCDVVRTPRSPVVVVVVVVEFPLATITFGAEPFPLLLLLLLRAWFAAARVMDWAEVGPLESALPWLPWLPWLLLWMPLLWIPLPWETNFSGEAGRPSLSFRLDSALDRNSSKESFECTKPFVVVVVTADFGDVTLAATAVDVTGIGGSSRVAWAGETKTWTGELAAERAERESGSTWAFLCFCLSAD